MSAYRTSAVALLVLFFVNFATPHDNKRPDAHKMFEQVQTLVWDILQGKNLEQAKSSVEAEAYLISGSNYEPLLEVLTGRSKTCNLNEGANRQIGFLSAMISDDLTTGYLIVKTESAEKKNERFHTINFMKSNDGGWKIKSWHTSK